MSGGPRQLFDPEAPPEAAASARRTASGGAEPEDRRGVHSIGGVYEQVEGALNQAFPRNRHLWVRGEIQHVSDHRSGHLYMSLVDPEDDGPRRDRSRGGVPTLNVKCWRSSWAPLRHGLAKQGIELAEGMVVVLRGSLDLYRAKGEISLVLAEVDVTALLGRLAAQRAQLLQHARRRRAAPTQRGAAPAGGPAPRRPGRQPGYRGLPGLPRAAHGFGVRVPCLPRAGHRAGPRCAVLHRPGASPRSAGATATSSPWCAAGERGRTWPPSRTKRSSVRSRPRPSRSSRASGTPGTRRWRTSLRRAACITPTECGQQIVRDTRLWWAAHVAEPAASAGPPRPDVPRRRAVPRHPGARPPDRGGAPAAPGASGAPGEEGVVPRTGGAGSAGVRRGAAQRPRGAARAAEPGSSRAPGRARAVVAPVAGCLRRRPAARAGLQPDAHRRRPPGAQRGRAGRAAGDRDPVRRRHGAEPGAGGSRTNEAGGSA